MTIYRSLRLRKGGCNKKFYSKIYKCFELDHKNEISCLREESI